MRSVDRERTVTTSSGVVSSGVRVPAAAAFIVAVVAHRTSVTYWFTASDTVPMIESSRVTGPGDLAAIFTQPMMAGTRFVEFALFYRPVSSLSYAVDHAVWGLDPAGYHLTSVLLHGVAAAAATVALAAVTRRRLAGASGGLLFAVHPVTAEVVPSAVRRHDVLVTIFLLAALVLFVRSRRATGGRGALAGSLVAFVLALSSKELALLFPGLVVAWVALGWDRPWSRDALADATRAVAPFLLVTAGVVAVRIAVLGQLGGYKRNSVPSPAEVVLILVEYPLSLGYPHDVVGMGVLPGAPLGWRVVTGVLAALGVPVLLAAAVTARRRGFAVPSGAALVTAATVVAVPAAIAAEPWLVRTVPVLYDPARLTVVLVYLRPSSVFVGLLLAGSVAGASVWAATDRSSSLRPADRRTLLFFAAWLVGPVVLFFPAGNYTFRSGYASLVPAMGALGLLFAVGLDGLRGAVRRTTDATTWRRVSAADVALVGVALLVVVPLVATSPLVHHYEGWAVSGRVNEATLTGVEAATEGAHPEAPVEIGGMLKFVGNRGCAFPQVKNLQFARPGTVEAWLRLHGEDRRVSSHDDRIVRGYPKRVRVTGGSSASNVAVTVHYEGTDPGTCVRSPWRRY